MGPILVGIATIVIVAIIVFLCVASATNPFIGVGAFVALFLLVIGALVEVSWTSADYAGKSLIVAGLVAALVVFLAETFRWGEVKHTHDLHEDIGQTAPAVVMSETSDPDDDDYDPSRLTSRYDDHH